MVIKRKMQKKQRIKQKPGNKSPKDNILHTCLVIGLLSNFERSSPTSEQIVDKPK